MPDSAETPEPAEERAHAASRAGHRRPSPSHDRFSNLWREPERLVVAAVLAVVAAVAIAAPHLPGRVGLITAGGAGQLAVGKAEASGRAAAHVRPAATTPIPPTPEQVAASTHVPPQLAAALRTWNSGPGGAALSQISSEVGAALQSGGMKSYAGMKSACASLGTSVTAAGAAPPIPNAAMQNKYSAALSVLAKGASDCRSAISVQPEGDEGVRTAANSAALHLAQTELDSGITSLASIRLVISAANAAA